MKKIHILLLLLSGILYFNSCELDNYESPTASLSGSFIDKETGEPVQSDIISGTRIGLIEQGYENPEIKYLVVKVDGTYRNDMLFEGKYSIPPIMNGNFVPQIDADSLTNDTLVIDIKGETTHDFVVQPYIRIKDATITIDGTKITAKFKLQQTVSNKVKAIGLFGHNSPSVGEPLQFGKKSQTLNKVTDPNTEYKLELDVRTDKDFEKGKAYFFRIGALIDAEQAEYNYAQAVILTIPAE